MSKWVPVPLPPFIIPASKKGQAGMLMAAGALLGLGGAIIGGTAGLIPGAIIGAGLSFLAGKLMQPGRKPGLSASRHYSTSTFPNPTDPDTPIPILYGTHRIIPIALQVSASPEAEGSGYGIPAVRKQGLSMLLGLCEGQVSDVSDIRINDQPVLSEERTEDVGTGNGSKKVFELPGRWAYLPSLTLTVNGTEKAQVTTSSTVTPRMPANGELTVARNPGERILPETVRVYIGGVEQNRSGSSTSSTYPWSIRVKSKRKIQIVFQTRPASQTTITVTFNYIGPNDLVIRQDGRGRVKLTFGTAPSNGHKIVATFKRSNVPGLSIEWRPGTLDQLPMTGFNEAWQSYTLGQELTKDTERTYSTDGRKVNDLRVGIVAPNGFVAFTSDGEGTAPTFAKVAIYYAPTDAAGNLDSGKWRLLYRLGDGDNLRAHFQLGGQSLSRKQWEVSVRSTLEALLAAGYTDLDGFTLDEEIEKLIDGTPMKVKVVRKDKVNADTSNDYLDRIQFGYASEVSEVLLSHPGTALLGLRCIVDESLAGGSPIVTCVATRAPLYDPRTGLWDGRSDNPALACYDLITSGNGTAIGRYGSRGWATSADIDSTTFEAWADWCDEWVHNDHSDKSRDASETNGERRHNLDIVLDSPQSLNEQVHDIAQLARAFCCLDGVRWRFPLDVNGTSQFAFVDSTTPESANIVAGSFEEGPDPLEDRPTDLVGQFWSEDREYQPETVHAQQDALADTAPRIQRQVAMRGITRPSEAERYIRHALESALNNTVSCTWLAHHGAILPEAGDLVTVTSQVPGGTNATGWSGQKVRVMAVADELPADGRLPLPRYVGRAISARPYAVTASRTATPPASSAGTGNSNAGGFGSPGSNNPFGSSGIGNAASAPIFFTGRALW